MWRGRKTGGWEGHRLSLVSGVLENNGIASYNPSCTRTHTHTLLDSTLWICSWPFRPHPFYTCQRTSLRRMRPPPGPRQKLIWPCFLSLRFLACRSRIMRQETIKRPQSHAFSFHRSPLHQRECTSLIFPNFQSFLASLFASHPSPTWGSFIKSCLFQIIYIQ